MLHTTKIMNLATGEVFTQTIDDEAPGFVLAKGQIVSCSECSAPVYRMRRNVYLGEKIASEQVEHVDGTPVEYREALWCSQCKTQFRSLTGNDGGRLIGPLRKTDAMPQYPFR